MLALELRKNIIWSIIQVISTLVMSLLVYKILIANIGLDGVGKWAVLIGLISLPKIFDLGLSNSTTRFIAKYTNDFDSQQQIFDTSQITLILINIAFIPILYLILYFVFPIIYQPEDLILISKILPLMISTGLLFTLSNVFLGTIDGTNRIYLRAYCIIFSGFIQLISVFILYLNLELLGLHLPNLLNLLFY